MYLPPEVDRVLCIVFPSIEFGNVALADLFKLSISVAFDTN